MSNIRISLLPAELKKQSSIVKMWTIVALVLTIIALVLLAGNILLSVYLKAPENELESLKTENTNLTENIGRISYIQEMFNTIDENNRIIENLQGEKVDWVYALDEALVDITVYGIKIDRLKITKTGASPGCAITATTDDISNVQRWSEEARTRDNITHVDLSNIQTLSEADDNITIKFDAAIGIESWTEGEEE